MPKSLRLFSLACKLKTAFLATILVLLLTSNGKAQGHSVLINNFDISAYTWDGDGNLYVAGKDNKNSLFLAKYDKDLDTLINPIFILNDSYNAVKLLITRNDYLMILGLKQVGEKSDLWLHKYDKSLNCLREFESGLLKINQNLIPITMLEDGNDDIIVLCKAKGLKQDPNNYFVGLIKFCCDNTKPMATVFNTSSDQPSSSGKSEDNFLMINYDNSYTYVYKYESNGKYYRAKKISMSFEAISVSDPIGLYHGVDQSEFLTVLRTGYQVLAVYNDDGNLGKVKSVGKDDTPKVIENDRKIIAATSDDLGNLYTVNKYSNNVPCQLEKNYVNNQDAIQKVWEQNIENGFFPTKLAIFSSSGFIAAADPEGKIKLFNAEGVLSNANIEWYSSFRLLHLFGNQYGIYAIGNNDSQTFIKQITQ